MENNDTEAGALTRRKMMLSGGGLIVGSMVLAACGDDDADAVTNTAAAAPAAAAALTANAYASVDPKSAIAIPEASRALFENADIVKLQKLPIALPGLESKVVFFEKGARTVPHRHTEGQHIVITSGRGVFGDKDGVHIVEAGDVIANPATEWHWHGALPSEAMTHVTIEKAGLDFDVERGDYDKVYTKDLGKKK
ncbi:MAG: cupin domain-containing protein [Sporichthyaceae bacterium]